MKRETEVPQPLESRLVVSRVNASPQLELVKPRRLAHLLSGIPPAPVPRQGMPGERFLIGQAPGDRLDTTKRDESRGRGLAPRVDHIRDRPTVWQPFEIVNEK